MKGIYLIKCKSENKVYIGQSKDIRKRYISHLSDLRKNKHKNLYLQEAFNKYGEKDFVFETIFKVNDEELDRQKLYDLEIFYISLYHSNDRKFGYNIESGGLSSGRFPKETINKMSDCKKGKAHSQKTKELLSKIRKGKPSHWKGKKQTKEHAEKRTKNQIGKVWVNNGVQSKFVTKENAEKLKSQGYDLGRPFFNRIKGKKYLYNGEMYTISQISKMCGIGRCVLIYRLNSGWGMEKATSTPIKK